MNDPESQPNTPIQEENIFTDSTLSEDIAPVQLTETDSAEKETAIILEDVDVFQKKILILSKVSFVIHKGDFVYLVGKTGAGKSSILKILLAEIAVKTGRAECAGFDLRTIKTRKIPYLRRKLGVIFQDYQLLVDKTVRENLQAALKATGWKEKKTMDSRIDEVLKLVHLETKDFKYPHQLSGGEQQRVCIARALLNNPEVILADEPTGNLDPISAEEIFQLLHDLNREQGTTVLMCTHNFTMLDKFPSRTICIEDGKLLDTML